MNNKIAVFLGENGKTISLNQSGTTKVYLKEKDEWKIIKEVIFESNDLVGSEMIRDNVKSMAGDLGDCRVFVASDVKGIPYTVLDGMGFNIWKVDGDPLDFLELVFEGEEKEKLNKQKPEIIPTPIKSGKEGNYFVDMKTEMQNNSNLSSKQILLPFIHKTTFNELEIICGHVPPWFEREFNGLNLRSEIEKINEGTVKVRVYSKDVIKR
ncbi:MAG TPA: Fe-only nitrogenase accessory protein AnfO [Clostridium sp.]